MHRFLVLSGLVLSAALIAPVAVSADDHHDKRYYDRDHKDYHHWNNQEDRAYRSYLVEQHREYRDFARANRNEQSHYFRWRHEHPDSTLFKVEIR